MFGFLQIFVRHNVLEYLFIIFNASQGFFIMVAFICNQRVCNLVLGKREPISSDGAVVTKQMSAQKNQSFD